MHLRGILRTWYWRHLRTRRAYGGRILYDELEWSGKGMSWAELNEFIDDLKGKRRP